MRRTKLTRFLLLTVLVFAPALTLVHANPRATGEEIVYVTKQGKKYHRENCKTIAGKTTFTMKLKDAVQGGYEPCKVCHPPVLPKDGR